MSSGTAQKADHEKGQVKVGDNALTSAAKLRKRSGRKKKTERYERGSKMDATGREGGRRAGGHYYLEDDAEGETRTARNQEERT